VVRNPERKRPPGRPRHGYEGNTKMHPRQVGWEGVDYIHLAQDRDQWRAPVLIFGRSRVRISSRIPTRPNIINVFSVSHTKEVPVPITHNCLRPNPYQLTTLHCLPLSHKTVYPLQLNRRHEIN
jgi:hypothetical protein